MLLLLLSTFKKATNSSLCLPLRGLSIDVSRKFIIKGESNSDGSSTRKYGFYSPNLELNQVRPNTKFNCPIPI